ncbi:MAG: hypothetical protein WAO57_03825 [Syntrophomonadaceae bacterium]
MTEYLLYVSLVFIPIACWIAYLLYQDGFDIITTIMVLILSYLMITAFPFSIQHLGTSVTIMVYGVMLIVLIMVISKPAILNTTRQRDELSPELAGESSLTSAGGETTIFSLTSTAAKSQQPEIQLQAEVASDSSLPDAVTPCPVAVADDPSHDLPVEVVYSDTIVETNLLSDNSAPTDDEITDVSGDDLVVEAMIPAELASVMPKEDDDSSSPKEHDKEESADHYREETLSTEQIILPSPDIVTTTDEVIIAQEPVSASDEAAIIPEPDSQPEEVSIAPEQVSPVEVYSDSSPIEEDDQKADSVTQQIEPEEIPVLIADDAVADKSVEDSEVVDWIELGFEAKSRGDMGLAVDSFARALRSTYDNELKHLLGMELVGILQGMGDYERAEDVLDDLIQNIDGQPDVVMELRQQKQYNSLLADELTRLGMADTPIFEVPRFVRIKVREKMLA